MTFPSLTRRQFLLGVGGVAAGTSIVTADAFTGARGRVEVTRHDVAIAGLPEAFAGLTLAQLTDIHFYDGMDRGARRAMELVAALAPDLTVFTGDYLEARNQLPEVGPFLSACRGRLGTIVTMGNWEHQVGVTPMEMSRISSAAGAVFLLNETHVVRRDGAALAIVGLDDMRVGLPSPERALPSVPPGATTIWAFHAPGYADLIQPGRYPIPALMLSGHTHGGQIRLPGVPAITPVASGRFVSGWYRDTFAPLYVSRGVGTSGIRARFRCAPEIALFTLRRA